MKGTILVVDDHNEAAELLRDLLRKRGFDATAVTSGQACLEHLKTHPTDVVLTDIQMPGMSGIELCLMLRERHPDLLPVVITGQGDFETAIAAIRAGTYDFITKPVKIDAVELAVSRALEYVTLRREVKRLRVADDRDRTVDGIAGNSPAVRAMVEMIRRVAGSDASVLITGESGTGKELVARALHNLSRRREQPFVAVNCAAMPASLLESELFGHVRGAFSGATNARRGLFEEAEGGTLLLDEIGSMPMAAQAKVLRALEEFQIHRLGDDRNVAVDVRILASTNLDMEAAIAQHIFRDDLYYRLAVVTLRVPPLREREEDKLALADHFLRMFSKPSEYPRRLSAEAKDLILHDPFPGNIRELKHSIEQALALSSRDELVAEDFPLLLARADAASTSEMGSVSGLTARTVTPERLKEVLEKTGGNRVEAARQLRISRSTLYRMLGKLPAEPPGT